MASKNKIISDILGDSYQSGSERLFYCPYCKHHKRKLSVNVDKNVYKCWVCDTNGRNLRRIVRRFGSHTQLAEWDKLTQQVNINDFYNIFEEILQEPEQIVELPKALISLANKDLPFSALKALKYLKKRGVTEKDIVKWKIGYCDSGPYAGRIIIPSFNNDGHANYYIARTYDSGWPRYKNPTVSRDIVFNELYVDWDEDIVLVEGAFDAIVAGNAIPLLGSTLREKSALFQKIVQKDAAVFLALDADVAKKENRIIKLFLKYGIELYKIDTSGYEDVGAMTKEVFLDRKENASFIGQDDYLLTAMLSMLR
jgi:DNA primase